MKILHVITSLKVGGAETALYHFLEEIKQYGHEHHVVYFYDGPYVQKIKELSIQVYHITGFVRGYDPVGFFQLNVLIRLLKPDIIHTALWAANNVGRVLGWWHGIPVINELHGNVIHEGFIRNLIDYYTVDLPSAIVSVSASVQESYQQAILDKRLNKKKVVVAHLVINNGVAIERLYQKIKKKKIMRSDFSLTLDDFVIGSIGRLEPIKSYGVLIRAVALFIKQLSPNVQKKIKVCLIGDGSERFLLEEEVKRLNLENNVIFFGMRHDACCFYTIFDCFVLSSQSEGLSIALLEAMACGLPIIATHSSKKHDVIDDNNGGYVVPVNDEHAFADALKKILNLIQSDEHVLKKFSQHNTFKIKHYFSLEKTISSYLDLYKKVLYKSVNR